MILSVNSARMLENPSVILVTRAELKENGPDKQRVSVPDTRQTEQLVLTQPDGGGRGLGLGTGIRKKHGTS